MTEASTKPSNDQTNVLSNRSQPNDDALHPPLHTPTPLQTQRRLYQASSPSTPFDCSSVDNGGTTTTMTDQLRSHGAETTTVISKQRNMRWRRSNKSRHIRWSMRRSLRPIRQRKHHLNGPIHARRHVCSVCICMHMPVHKLGLYICIFYGPKIYNRIYICVNEVKYLNIHEVCLCYEGVSNLACMHDKCLQKNTQQRH